jgi:uncharacterized protein
MLRRLLIVFAKAPVAGRVKTRLAKTLGDAESLCIYRFLAKRVWSQALEARDELGFELWLYFDPPSAVNEMSAWLSGANAYESQPEGDLGDRIIEAYRRGFAAGFSSVTILGTDAPEIRSSHFQEAFERSALNRVIVGPAMDGGFYLMTLNHHRPELFQNVPWSAAHTRAAIQENAKRLGIQWQLLQEERDIDEAEDWAWWKDQNPEIIIHPS